MSVIELGALHMSDQDDDDYLSFDILPGVLIASICSVLDVVDAAGKRLLLVVFMNGANAQVDDSDVNRSAVAKFVRHRAARRVGATLPSKIEERLDAPCIEFEGRDSLPIASIKQIIEGFSTPSSHPNPVLLVVLDDGTAFVQDSETTVGQAAAAAWRSRPKRGSDYSG